jgi:hypothetical protein
MHEDNFLERRQKKEEHREAPFSERTITVGIVLVLVQGVPVWAQKAPFTWYHESANQRND